jgi:putative ABC transport system permease protein
MAQYFPEIENYVRLSPMSGGLIQYKEAFFKLKEAFQCDSTFFHIFNAELLLGNPENILDAPGSMILSESFAKKVFGSLNPIGEMMTLPAGQFYGEPTNFIVAGVIKDFPPNSHFHPELLCAPLDESIFQGWAWTYLLLFPKAEPDQIRAGFKEFYAAYIDSGSDEITTEAHLQKLTHIHLQSRKTREIEANSNMIVIYSFSIAAFLLLFIALINYANLNMGMAAYRSKYLFVSRVFGSSRRMQGKYFLTEGALIILVAIFLSAFLSAFVNLIVQKQFNLNLMEGNIPTILMLIVLFSLLTILTGILPSAKKLGSKGLFVLQYTISIVLIIAVFVIHRQTDFALQSGMGLETDELICFENVHSELQMKFAEFKEEVLKYNSIESVTAMMEPPGGEANDMFRFTMEGFVADASKTRDDYIGIFPCDYSFASIFNLKFLGGDNFSETFEDHEGSGEYIINESAMRRLNYTDPKEIIGKQFDLSFDYNDIPIPLGKIIGVVEDFHLSSIKRKIEPLVLFKRKDLWLINFVIAFRPGMQKQALADLESVWEEIYPAYPMEFEYLSSMYRNLYSTELLQTRLLSVFTFIALFTCSMGLLGLSLLSTQRRVREIGIRRVNGAETIEIMNMLNWDFMKWIILSYALAIPIAYLALEKWLENYAYKTALSWWIFALAGGLAMTIALVTVSAQSWRASRKNPVESLKYE